MPRYLSTLVQQFRGFGVVARRELTVGEKALVRSIFADSIALDRVHIVAHKLILKNYALSPNGQIYFHPQNYCEDFSKSALRVQSWFIHEMISISSIKIDNNYKFQENGLKVFFMYNYVLKQ
jgi:hypothetical protein